MHPTTAIEIITGKLLTDMAVPFVAEKRVGHWTFDFFVPSRNLVIECDGTYWHRKLKIQLRDQRKDDWLVKHGYCILRLTEDEIRKNRGACADKILAVIDLASLSRESSG